MIVVPKHFQWIEEVKSRKNKHFVLIVWEHLKDTSKLPFYVYFVNHISRSETFMNLVVNVHLIGELPERFRSENRRTRRHTTGHTKPPKRKVGVQ